MIKPWIWMLGLTSVTGLLSAASTSRQVVPPPATWDQRYGNASSTGYAGATTTGPALRTEWSWSQGSTSGGAAPMAFKDKVFYGDGYGFYAQFKSTGQRAWDFTPAGEFFGDAGIPACEQIGTESRIYTTSSVYGTGTSVLYALRDDGASHTLLWRVPLSNRFLLDAPTLWEGKILFVYCDTSSQRTGLMALASQDGRILFDTNYSLQGLGNLPITKPTVDPINRRIFAYIRSQGILGFDESGQEILRVLPETLNPVTQAPLSVDPAKGQLLVTFCYYNGGYPFSVIASLRSYDTRTGALKWDSRGHGKWANVRGGHVLRDGIIYLAGGKGSFNAPLDPFLAALDAATGAPLWENRSVHPWRMLITQDAKLWVESFHPGTNAKALFGVEASTGSVLGSPLALHTLQDFCADKNNLYVFNAEGGSFRLSKLSPP